MLSYIRSLPWVPCLPALLSVSCWVCFLGFWLLCCYADVTCRVAWSLDRKQPEPLGITPFLPRSAWSYLWEPPAWAPVVIGTGWGWLVGLQRNHPLGTNSWWAEEGPVGRLGVCRTFGSFWPLFSFSCAEKQAHRPACRGYITQRPPQALTNVKVWYFHSVVLSLQSHLWYSMSQCWISVPFKKSPGTSTTGKMEGLRGWMQKHCRWASRI